MAWFKRHFAGEAEAEAQRRWPDTYDVLNPLDKYVRLTHMTGLVGETVLHAAATGQSVAGV